MAFPDIRKFPKSNPGPYELQMGGSIVALLRLFSGCVPDPDSHTRVLELASEPTRWSAAHAVFDEVRGRRLADVKDKDAPREHQHFFEESCCTALYNATDPPDPFDASSPFFVAGAAIGLARAVAVPVEKVAIILAPITAPHG